MFLSFPVPSSFASCSPSPSPVFCFLPTPLLLSPVIDHCSFGNHSCQHECVSIPNGHYCRCRSGFTLQPDSRSCRGRSRRGIATQPLMSSLVPREGLFPDHPAWAGVTLCFWLVFQPPISAMGWITAASSSASAWRAPTAACAPRASSSRLMAKRAAVSTGTWLLESSSSGLCTPGEGLPENRGAFSELCWKEGGDLAGHGGAPWLLRGWMQACVLRDMAQKM